MKNTIPKTALSNILIQLCNKDELLALYVARYIAFVLRNPAQRMNTALVFSGVQGSGKSFFFHQLCKAMSTGICSGKISLNETSWLESSFNTYLNAETRIAIFEDYETKLHKTYLEKIKSYIAAELITLNHKGISPQTVPALVSFILLLQNPLKGEERRFQSIHCEKRIDMTEISELPESDYEFINWLLNDLDLSNFSSSSVFI